jgi:hypothetical protein
MNRLFFICALFLSVTAANAQEWDENPGRLQIGNGLQYNIEMQASVSKGQTPLWLNANKYGLSSLDKTNGYLRASVLRPLSTDSMRRWGIGYGLDLVAPYHYTSKMVVQQAFAELRWLHGALTVGSKQFPMELKNNALSSGSQTLGINARPIPQVRLSLPDYWTLPFGNGWWHIKGHIAYGKMTDDNWQHDFTNYKSRYTDGTLFHSKAGYLKIGNEEQFYPLSLELGLEMGAQFGGTTYSPQSDGSVKIIKGGKGVKDFWKAFMPGGSDVPEEGTVYQNAEGNQLGSWLVRLNYDADTWHFSLYGDHYFEDHSSMFLLDYDGYGTGDNWNTREKRRYTLYDLKDMLVGAELNFKYSRWLRDIVFEYIYTKYQSGPVYHDHTQNLSDHIGGQDNYYNHYIYTGWQHWGQVMGNPLFRSPIYNSDGTIMVEDNRFKAFHLGVDGQPTENFDYRLLATYQEGFGTYDVPYTKKHHNISFMLEATYHLAHNWNIKGAYAMDFGAILGHNAGFQLTISKSGIFNL